MSKKLNSSEVNSKLQEFADVTYEKYSNYAYACGAFQSQLSHAIADMPAHKQNEMIQLFESLTKMNKV